MTDFTQSILANLRLAGQNAAPAWADTALSLPSIRVLNQSSKQLFRLYEGDGVYEQHYQILLSYAPEGDISQPENAILSAIEQLGLSLSLTQCAYDEKAKCMTKTYDCALLVQESNQTGGTP